MTVTLVTGGNRGIGYAIVKLLADRLPSPSTIIIGCRDAESGKQALEALREEKRTAADLDVVTMDIEHDDSIRAAVAAVGQKYGKLDCQYFSRPRLLRKRTDEE